MKWLAVLCAFLWFPQVSTAANSCEGRASPYFTGDSDLNSQAFGARTWRLLTLKKLAEGGEECGQSLLARALQESKDYWHHIAKKYSCPEPPAEQVQNDSCPLVKLQSVAANLNYLRLIEFGSLDRSEESKSSRTKQKTEATVCDGTCAAPTTAAISKHQLTNAQAVAKVVTQIPPPKGPPESPAKTPQKGLQIMLVDRANEPVHHEIPLVVAQDFRTVTWNGTPAGQVHPDLKKGFYERIKAKPESANERYQLAHDELLRELAVAEENLKSGLARKADRPELAGLQDKVIELRNKRVSLEAAWAQFSNHQGE